MAGNKPGVSQPARPARPARPVLPGPSHGRPVPRPPVETRLSNPVSLAPDVNSTTTNLVPAYVGHLEAAASLSAKLDLIDCRLHNWQGD